MIISKDIIYKTLADSENFYMIILDAKYNIIELNKKAEQFLNPYNKNIINKNYFEILGETEREKQFNICERVIKEKIELSFIENINDLILRINVLPVKNKNNNINYLMLIAQDITMQIKTHEQLTKMNNRFKEIIENSKDLIIIADKNLNVIYINKVSEVYYGVKPIDLINKSLLDFIYEKDKPEFIKNYKEWKLHKFEHCNFENRIVNKKNNKIFDFYWSNNIKFNNENKIELIYSIGRNITELHNLQKQVINAEKLSSVGQLASGIAHEFNNLMTIIQGNAELLSFKYKQKDILDSVNNIKESVKKGKDIVRQINLFALPEKPEFKKVLLSKLIDEIIVFQQKQIDLEKIEVIRDYQANIYAEIDVNQFRQAILNLFINAVHALILQKNKKIEISVKKDNNFACIIFKDNGKGIEKKYLDKIFDPFFTTKGAYSTDDFILKGIGLGLTVLNRIVNNHNGNISVNSVPYKGTEFIVKIPVRKNNIKKNELLNINENYKGNVDLNILVVDDELSIVDLVKEMLDIENYKNIYVADSGEKALSIVKTKKIDLVILDYLIPDIKGDELFKKIKIINENVNVIIMSGKLEEIKQKLKNQDVLGYLDKPFKFDEIISLIKNIQ